MAKRAPRSFAVRLAHDDAGIERDHALGVGQQRIDVELGDLAHVGDELRQPHQGVAHGAARGRRPVAIAAQQAVDARAAQRILGQHRVERRQGERLVVDHLGRHAAMADQQDRPEHRILGRAQDQLDGMRPLDHRLHHEAVDARAGRRGADLVGHGCARRRRPPAPSRGRAATPPTSRLVGDLARQDSSPRRESRCASPLPPPRRRRARPRSARRECRRPPAPAWLPARSGSRASRPARPCTMARTSCVSERASGTEGGVRWSARWPRRYCTMCMKPRTARSGVS